jgi:glycosyltransferase involved in cell wall biosynthesis
MFTESTSSRGGLPPKISLVTPSFNQRKWLSQAIKSVINQNYPNLEYVVVDGLSTDGSIDEISCFRSQLTKVIIEKDKGQADAIQKGFSHTSGEIMGWLNSDDLHYPWTLSTVGLIFDTFPEVQWIMGQPTFFDAKGNSTGCVPYMVGAKNYTTLTQSTQLIQQESTFWRRTLWDSAGGFLNTEVELALDAELWCRFFQKTNLWNVQSILGGFRFTGLNRSQQQFDRYLLEAQPASNRLRDCIMAQSSQISLDTFFIAFDHRIKVWRKYRIPNKV